MHYILTCIQSGCNNNFVYYECSLSRFYTKQSWFLHGRAENGLNEPPVVGQEVCVLCWTKSTASYLRSLLKFHDKLQVSVLLV